MIEGLNLPRTTEPYTIYVGTPTFPSSPDYTGSQFRTPPVTVRQGYLCLPYLERQISSPVKLSIKVVI
jgi:hypothetical protein